MNIATQTLAITAMNLRDVPRRLGNSLVIVIGITSVVAVLIPVFAMISAFRATIQSDGRPDRAIVLSRGATSEYESSLSRENLATLMNASAIKRDEHDRPIISAEVTLVAPVARKRDNSDVNITLRGVGDQYFAMRPELKLVAGRMFQTGKQELLVGESARAQFIGLEVGNAVRLSDGDWTVVGTFAGGNGSRESELVADAQTVMSAYKLESFNSAIAMLNSAPDFGDFKGAVTSDPTLAVDVRTEPEYLATASSPVNRMLRLVAYTIGSVMALGALFGAINSMHAAVAARRMEIATLRAIGFDSTAVAIAVLIESVVLAFCGGLIGVGIAYAAFDGKVMSTLGGAVWDSQLVYSLTITPSLVSISILLACTLGLLGAIPPAFHAARTNIPGALSGI